MGRDATDTDARQLGDAQRSRQAGVWTGRRLFAAILLVIALVFRLAPLNRYVTPDEPAWVYRSVLFSQALAARDFSAVPATGHPGVTTMWLGSLGLQIQRLLSPNQAAAHLDWLDGLAGLSPQSPAAFRHLAFFLPTGRVLVALVTSLGVVGVFFLTRRLWGLPVAVLATLLLAFDPFLAGHSGLLHLDGLLATMMMLSVLAMLVAVHSFHSSRPAQAEHDPTDVPDGMTSKRSAPYRWMAVSGILAGLAVLTKTPGGVLALFVGLLLVAAWLTRRITWRQALIVIVVWTLTAGLTVLAVYPALWVNPVGTLRGMFEVGGRHVEGAIRPIFYRGQVTYDPDTTFYPVVWLFRASPLVMVGLLIALVVCVPRPVPRRFDIVMLIALAFGFLLFVTLVGKKHDRYLLPAFPLLTLAAALGWQEIWNSGIRRFGMRKLGAQPQIPAFLKPRNLYIWLVPAVLILLQLLLIVPFFNAPLGYFNPLLGGPRAALDWLEVGWGEGLGAAARWLNQQPNAEALIVATPSIPPFASFFVGQTMPLDQQTIYQADYVVQPPRQGAEQFFIVSESHSSVYETRIGGIIYADVVPSPAVDEQVTYIDDRTRQGDLIILDAEAALMHLYEGPADMVALADARDSAEIAARLEALIPDHDRLWYVALPAASPITARHIQQQLACFGRLVSSESVAGVTISQTALNNSRACDGQRTQWMFTPNTQYASLFTFRASGAEDTLGLTDALLSNDPIAWPDHLRLIVRWAALGSTCPGELCPGLCADYRTILYLKDESGRVWARGGQEILDADYRRPTAWSSDEWTDQTFHLVLPAGIPPGRYTVELGVFDPASGRTLSAWDAAGSFVGLSAEMGQVTIAPPPDPPSPWDMVIAERFTPPLASGSLNLLGYAPPPDQIASGDRVSFDLFWQATAAPEADYILRWRLYGADGDMAVEETVPLSPYPTGRWRDRELEQVRYDLPVAPEFPAGDYTLSVNVLDAHDAPTWAEDVTLARFEIVARDRLFTLPSDIAYPLDVTLGDVVHLRGFDLDVLSVQPRGQLPLTLYWQADGPTDLSYTVFVHLVGPDGMLFGQSDRPPVGGAAPTHTWARGQVIIDEIGLPVLADASPGTYHIAVGLYDPVSGDRLPVYDATGTELPNLQIVLPVEITVQ